MSFAHSQSTNVDAESQRGSQRTPLASQERLEKVDDVPTKKTWYQYLQSTPTHKDPNTDAPPPPDNGAAAWLQVFLTHLVCFNTWGFIISFGAFQTYYHSILTASQSDISWIGSTQVFLIYAIGVFSGRALDAGYFHLTFGAGTVFLVLGVFMTSLATNYWEIFLAQALCVGIGSGLQFCPSMALVGTYFHKNRVFALALALTGAGTGGLVYPAIVRQLINRPEIGFPWTVRILGFIMLVTSVLAFFLFRPRLPPRPTGPLIEFSALREKTYTFFILGFFFAFWAMYFEFYYVGQYARTKLGFSYEGSIDLLLLTNGIGIIGRLIPAWLANSYTGPLNMIIPSAMATGIAYYSWAAVDTTNGQWAFAAFYGIFSNVVQGLWPSALGSMTADPSKSGARMGLAFTIVSFGLLTGPPLGGALVQQYGYLSAQVWGGTCLMVGVALMAVARVAKTGWSLMERC